jgi:hypothetical protein
MAFKVKDLMINVLPDVGAQRLHCPDNTIIPCLANSVCVRGSCGCTVLSPQTCFGYSRPSCIVNSVIPCTETLPTTCFYGSCGCTVLSPQTCLWGSCGINSGITCGGFTINCVGSACGGSETPVFQGGGEVGPETLAALKEQLRQALAQVEAQERAVEESLRPQSVAEVEQLEQKMKAALEELRVRKEELQKKASGGQG